MTDKKNGILPENINDIEDPLAFKLQNEIDEANWELLEPHYERGALVFIDPSLNLVEVASKIIRDDVDEVKAWTEKKLIYNPKEENREVDKSVKYRFIITQPYVLIQPIMNKE